MMKIRSLILGILLSMTMLSCIRDEAPNAEADILTCSVSGSILKSEPEIDNNSITLIVKSDADITHLAPVFTLTPGATVVPANGTSLDFTSPQTYTVTSEDKQWTKTYTVRCVISGVSTEYHFENIMKETGQGRYDIFYDVTSTGEKMNWASANEVYVLTGVASSPDQFPTSQAENGYEGKCAKLTTCSTGSLGSMVGMYIAAGNLFIGSFDPVSALTSPLKATKFGKPFESVPTYLSGYYKYKSGDNFTEKGKPVSGKRDKCDIYAIFYETTNDVRTLDGTNALTSPNLISIARIMDQEETDEWTHFYIPFVAQPGKVIDKEKLKNGGYQLAVVFSSSIRGDYFEGAVGSTLYVDEVEVIHSDDNK